MQCFNGAIEACAVTDDLDRGLSLMAEMGRCGVEPDKDSFGPLVAACGRLGNTALAGDLYGAMAKLGLEPR